MPDKKILPEGPESEWKLRLPIPARTARSLSALANGNGGILWVGIHDDGQIQGIPGLGPVRKELAEAMALVEPPVSAQVHPQMAGDRLLARIEVQRCLDGPVGVRQPDGGTMVYVREADTNRPASPRTIKALGAPSKIKVGPGERATLLALKDSGPLSAKELGTKVRMGERRAKRLVVSLMQAGLVHDREGRKYALTALGARFV